MAFYYSVNRELQGQPRSAMMKSVVIKISQKVSIEYYQILTWHENGLKYSIGEFDCSFTIEEMIEMAHTIISEK